MDYNDKLLILTAAAYNMLKYNKLIVDTRTGHGDFIGFSNPEGNYPVSTRVFSRKKLLKRVDMALIDKNDLDEYVRSDDGL